MYIYTYVCKMCVALGRDKGSGMRIDREPDNAMEQRSLQWEDCQGDIVDTALRSPYG